MNTWSFALSVNFTTAVEESVTHLQGLGEHFPLNVSVTAFTVIGDEGHAFPSPMAVFRSPNDAVKLKLHQWLNEINLEILAKAVQADGSVANIDTKSIRLDVVKKPESNVKTCPFCQAAINKNNWARHIRSCGGSNVCFTCLNRVDDLTEHQKLCNVRKYDCAVCGQSFLSASARTAHSKRCRQADQAALRNRLEGENSNHPSDRPPVVEQSALGGLFRIITLSPPDDIGNKCINKTYMWVNGYDIVCDFNVGLLEQNWLNS